MDGRVCADCADRRGHDLFPYGNQSRRDEGVNLMGAGVHVSSLNAWFGAKQALYDINIEIPPNQATAVIGPSGCGKSTFVRCVNRMHETIPEARVQGKIQIGDSDVYGRGVSPVSIRRRIGMVFQKPNPFPTMSIYDNVAAGLK